MKPYTVLISSSQHSLQASQCVHGVWPSCKGPPALDAAWTAADTADEEPVFWSFRSQRDWGVDSLQIGSNLVQMLQVHFLSWENVKSHWQWSDHARARPARLLAPIAKQRSHLTPDQQRSKMQDASAARSNAVLVGTCWNPYWPYRFTTVSIWSEHIWTLDLTIWVGSHPLNQYHPVPSSTIQYHPVPSSIRMYQTCSICWHSFLGPNSSGKSGLRICGNLSIHSSPGTCGTHDMMYIWCIYTCIICI